MNQKVVKVWMDVIAEGLGIVLLAILAVML